MSDQFLHTLYGSYAFLTDTHRAQTAKNLYLGGDSLAPTVTSNAVTCNAALSGSFYVQDTGNTAITCSNLVQGQTISVVFKAVGANRTPTFPNCTGTISAVTSGNAALFRVTKVAAHLFVTQTALGAY